MIDNRWTTLRRFTRSSRDRTMRSAWACGGWYRSRPGRGRSVVQIHPTIHRLVFRLLLPLAQPSFATQSSATEGTSETVLDWDPLRTQELPGVLLCARAQIQHLLAAWRTSVSQTSPKPDHEITSRAIEADPRI